MIEPRWEEKSEMRVVGLHTKFISGLAIDTNAPNLIGPLWGQLHQRIGEIEAADPGVFYGVVSFPPKEERSHSDELDYVAGIEVAPGYEPPEGMVALTVPAGLRAVFEHRGVMWDFEKTLRAIYREWYPQSGYEHTGVADIERYDEQWAHDSEDSVFEYWLGLKPSSR